jgi:hypothetical protein
MLGRTNKTSPGALLDSEPRGHGDREEDTRWQGSRASIRLPCQTNPIWRPRDFLRQTNPIGRRTGYLGTPIGRPRHKQSQSGGAAHRAKQSQFLRSGAEGKYFEGKELWSIGHPRGPGETKPIHPNRRGRGIGRPPCAPRGPIVQNEPNFGDTIDRSRSEDLFWRGRAGRLCRTRLVGASGPTPMR